MTTDSTEAKPEQPSWEELLKSAVSEPGRISEAGIGEAWVSFDRLRHLEGDSSTMDYRKEHARLIGIGRKDTV